MAHLYSVPDWFLEINLAFHLVFIIVSALVALYAYRIYKLSGQRELKLFSLSFAFLSLSHLVEVFISIFFLSVSGTDVHPLIIQRIPDVQNISVAFYILFFILGLVTLLYTTLKIKRLRVYTLLIVLTFAAINYSFNKPIMIYLISSLFLLFVNYHYLMEYREKRNCNLFLVFVGITALFLSNLLLLLEPNSILTYVSSNTIELIGYIFIAFSLLKVIKDGKKKKPVRDNKRHS
jgi:hypothetical protein